MKRLRKAVRFTIGSLVKAYDWCAELLWDIRFFDKDDWTLIGLWFFCWSMVCCGLIFKSLWVTPLLLFAWPWALLAGHRFGTLGEVEHQGEYRLDRTKNGFLCYGYFAFFMTVTPMIALHFAQISYVQFAIRQWCLIITSYGWLSLMDDYMVRKCKQEYQEEENAT